MSRIAENAGAVIQGRTAIRLGLAVGAVALTACWFAEIEWYVFWSSDDWDEWLESSTAPAISDFLSLYGGVVIGALAGFATGGRARLVVGTLAGIAAVTVTAFAVMPWDSEVEGGSGVIMWWTLSAAVAALICAGLSAVVGRVARLRQI